jgi:hypothetical protein
VIILFKEETRMKTKNNTFKRIAAGALATISVATNVMSANVGGTLFVDTMRAALVAQAADGTVDFGGINKYLTSFSNGKTTFDANALAGITSFAAKEGDTVTVKSSIPLNFVQKIDNVAVNADMFDADTTTKVDNTAYVPSTDAYDAANFTKVYSAKTGKEFQIAKIGNDGKETINVGDITTENDITGCSFYPANVDLVVKKNSAGNDVIAYADTNGTFIEADRLMAYEGTSTDTEIFYANVINVAKSTASGAAFEQNTYSLNTGYSAFEYEGGNTWNAVNGETTNFINSANDGVDSKYIFFQGNVQAENINEAGTQAYVVDKTITSDNFEEKKADLYLKKDNPDTLAVIWEPQASAVVFDTQADYYKLENAVNDAATACTLTKVKTTGTYKAYTIELDAAGNITSAIEENNLNLGNDDVIDITAENNKYSLLKAADANNIVLVPDGTSVLKDADDYLHFVKNAGATTPANWKKETILVTAQAGDEGTKYSTDKLKEGTGDTIADATASDLIEKTLTLTHDALDTYTFINVNDGVNALGVARTLAWGTEENNTNLPLYVKAGPENLTTGYKFIGAAADAAYYKVIDEQHDNENETTTLKNGRVYFTKSGNSYVYSYKINSNVKIIGQEAKVEVTNGLADANDIWGDNTTNARLTGPRTAVDDLTLTSDLNPNGVNVVNDANAKAAYKNENVVLSSSNYFKVRIWNGKQKTAYKEYATKFNSKTNKWESTFPVYVDAEGDITQVLVEKADPVYTYTTNGSVLSVSGSGIDSEAAYIKAYAVSKADAETNGQGKPVSDAEKKKYAITSDTTQSYGSSVYVDIERIAEFASAKNSVNEYSTLKITRNGNEITGEADNPETEANETVALGNTIHNDKYDADVPANDSINRAQNFTFNQPGEYEITYTVYINANKTTAVAKELKFKFTIDTQAKLTASNVKLTFSSKDAGIITGATEVTNENADQFPDEIEVGSYAKVVTGAENLKLPVDVEDLKNKSIDVTATLVDAQGRDLDDIKVILSGATTVNELNLSQPLYITYNNDQYSTGSETIVINWQAVSKAKQFNIFQPNGETPLYTELGNNYEVNVSVDEIADIQKIVESNYVLKNGDAKKISYEYSVGKGDKLESQELDWHEAGFPKEIGEYSLYILYANEPIAIVDLNVIKHSLHAAPTDAQLNITYGDKLFTEEELGYADAEGNAVKDADVKNPEIKFYETEPVEDAQVKQIVDGKLNGAPVYEKDGKYYTLGDDVEDPYDAPLNAGVYVAEIKAKGGNATTVGKADYTLMSDTFVLSVAKKQITADMITIAPKNYKNDYYTINAEDIEGKDTAITKNFANAATAVSLKIASGEQSGKNIGGYTVNVTVDDKAEVQNYTGTVKNFKWYIIKGAEKDGENYSGLFWNDTETTIVDNGNINVEFGKSANLVGEVVEFGFIGDKSGKIGAPAIANGESYMSNKTNGIYNYSENFDPDDGDAYEADDEAHMADPNVQAAYKELVYGAGINPAKQNAAMIAKKGADTFGVSVRIEDANTGVWVRPYLILKVDGEDKLYYGEVRYLNLVEEATAMLNLKASAMGAANNNDHVAQEAVTKDQAKAQYADNSDLAYMEDAKSGYWAEKNQFYAYAHYNFDKNSKVKDSAIQGFGVVLDKSGYIPAGTTLDDNDEAFKKAKEVLIPANKGKNGILSGISKDNPKMLKNEMGVAVNPKDAVTGVWLRSFVDFGNGLIVYTDPVYIKSVSEQYADCKPGVVGQKAANAAKINYTVTANVVDDNAGDAAVVPKFKGANAVIKEAGVVVDKNGTLFKLNDEGKYTGFVDDIKTKFIADNATANGYNKGKKGIDINPATVGTTIFTGHAFQVTNKSGNYIKTVARPFVVYTINGKDITIYGDPVEDTTLNTTYPEPVND